MTKTHPERIHGPQASFITFPGHDDSDAFIDVDFTTWGDMWMWRAASFSVESDVYEMVVNDNGVVWTYRTHDMELFQSFRREMP